MPEWTRAMSASGTGRRLAPTPPAWGPAPVVAVPAATTRTSSPSMTWLMRRSRRPTLETRAPAPAPGSWPARRARTTASVRRAIPTMKWVMTT